MFSLGEQVLSSKYMVSFSITQQWTAGGTWTWDLLVKSQELYALNYSPPPPPTAICFQIFHNLIIQKNLKIWTGFIQASLVKFKAFQDYPTIFKD